MVPHPEFYWHTTPLHFLPAIVQEGTLRASAHPRPRSLPRRRKLGLDGFVHLSFVSQTPLLADKLQRGYPHALLAFSPEIAQRSGAGFLRWNTMRWAHREEFVPIVEPEAKAQFLVEWHQGKYPSAELLIPENLPLTSACGLYLASPEEADWLARLSLSTPPIHIEPERFPPRGFVDLAPLWAWADACREAGQLLLPPDLPFD